MICAGGSGYDEFQCLTLLRARGAASGVLGDVDSLAVSDVELSDELLLDNSLLDGRLVANCRTHDLRIQSILWSANTFVPNVPKIEDGNYKTEHTEGEPYRRADGPVKWTIRGLRSLCAPPAVEGPDEKNPVAACELCRWR